MANVNDPRPARRAKAASSHNFRYLRPDVPLEDQGFYSGFPCLYGHTIRDAEHHWCYHCALRIRNNICGLDVNFVHTNYQNTLYRVIQNLTFTNPDDLAGSCWHMKEGFKDPSYPSWRSWETGYLADRVKPKKILYQAFWGDVGKLYVTTAPTVCSDKRCVNPLHTVSSLNCESNRRPTAFQYLDLKFDVNKAVVTHLRHRKSMTIDQILKAVYKPTIRDPKIEGHMQTRQNIGNDKPERISTREITTESP